MGNKSQIKAGAVLAYIQLILANMLPIIINPITIRMLGKSEYGLLGLAQSVISFLALLSFGISGSVVRYITIYKAKGDKEKVEKIVGIFFSIFLVIAAVVAIVGFTLSFFLGSFFPKITAEELKTLRNLFYLMTFNTAAAFPLSIFASIIIAHERFIINKLLMIVSTVASYSFNLILLLVGFKSIGIVLSTTIVSTSVFLVYAVYSTKVLKIRLRITKPESGILKEILGFSAFIFLAEIVNMLYWSTDKIIIGSSLGTTFVAVYTVAANLNIYMQSFTTAISGMNIPRVTTMVAKEATHEELTSMFVRFGRIQFVIVSLVATGFIVLGKPFIAMWAGKGYEDAYPLTLLVMLPVTIPIMQSVGLNIIVAQNKHRFRAIMFAAIAVVNVIVSLILVKTELGMFGPALSTCIAFTIGPVIIMNFYYHFKTGLNIPFFWKNILMMAPVPVIMTLAGSFIFGRYIIVDGWWSFLFCALCYAAIFAVLMFFIAMNKYEKDIFINPVKKIIRKLKRGHAA